MEAITLILVPVLLTTSVTAQCSDDDRPMNITTPGVRIQSPGFNGEDPYPANQTCEWLITTDRPVNVVTVTFVTLLVERCDDCQCDSVTVYDGADDSAPVLRTLCGAPSTPLSITGSRTMFIRFTSNEIHETAGFEADIEFTDKGCIDGVTVTEPAGWLTSPNYPNDYPNQALCTWNFAAPEGQRIQIHFEDFALQDSTCDFPLIGGGAIPDFVLFTENDGQTELARWYGFMDAANALSYRNYDSGNATVMFLSDETTAKKGFNMTWTFVDA